MHIMFYLFLHTTIGNSSCTCDKLCLLPKFLIHFLFIWPVFHNFYLCKLVLCRIGFLFPVFPHLLLLFNVLVQIPCRYYPPDPLFTYIYTVKSGIKHMQTIQEKRKRKGFLIESQKYVCALIHFLPILPFCQLLSMQLLLPKQFLLQLIFGCCPKLTT